MRISLLATVVFLAAGTAAGRAEGPAGASYPLTDGRLFIPFGQCEPELLIHLHGAAFILEPAATRAGWKGAVATVSMTGLSGVYTTKFREAAVFQRIVREARERIGLRTDFRRVMVSSFSAGFGGVRELMKQPEAYQRINALLLADTVYAGLIGDPAKRQVDPEDMEGFLRYARDAAAGRKRMLITHSALIPSYASTAETADYLIARLGGASQPSSGEPSLLASGLRQLTSFRKGGFEVLGFAGETGEDHMKHLRQIHLFLRLLCPPKPPAVDPWS